MDAEPVPSLTVTVMVACPAWPASGVTVTVRVPPLPPNAMPASATSAWFDDVPDSVRLAEAVSMSLTVKGSGPAVALASMV